MFARAGPAQETPVEDHLFRRARSAQVRGPLRTTAFPSLYDFDPSRATLGLLSGFILERKRSSEPLFRVYGATHHVLRPHRMPDTMTTRRAPAAMTSGRFSQFDPADAEDGKIGNFGVNPRDVVEIRWRR